jgi:hypothetical protein
MLRTFIEKSITSAHAEKNTGLTDSMIDGITRCGEVVPLEIESSKDGQKILFYRNTPMLASGIKGMRVQLGKGSDRYSISFMRRRLACPACLQRGAPPPFDF